MGSFFVVSFFGHQNLLFLLESFDLDGTLGETFAEGRDPYVKVDPFYYQNIKSGYKINDNQIYAFNYPGKKFTK